jgi:hypothetical protein
MCTTTTGGVCMSADHERLKKDDAWWAAQRFIGFQRVDGTAYLELRNCSAVGCDSTLARWVDGVAPDPEKLQRDAENAFISTLARRHVFARVP